jgi:glutaminyl-tRNA synthetase
LRFDDTNPEKENVEFIESIKKDIEWLGYQWDEMHFASDYFNNLYNYALKLISEGYAYIDSSSPDEIKRERGTLTEPGINSKDRDRAIEENLKIFEEMKNGKHEDGKYVLRLKIDMSSPNINMRDPIIYRIKNFKHHKTGNDWCIYPMYDFTHCISDAIENVTHSLCTLEFEDHRELYDWIIKKIGHVNKPQQIEFARLALEHNLMSKRKLSQLVEEKYVSGWDDPRMPTISGMRRRGFTPNSIKDFCSRIGITKKK